MVGEALGRPQARCPRSRRLLRIYLTGTIDPRHGWREPVPVEVSAAHSKLEPPSSPSLGGARREHSPMDADLADAVEATIARLAALKDATSN